MSGSLDRPLGQQAEIGLDTPPRLSVGSPDPKASILSHPGADGTTDLPMSPELAHSEDQLHHEFIIRP